MPVPLVPVVIGELPFLVVIVAILIPYRIMMLMVIAYAQPYPIVILTSLLDLEAILTDGRSGMLIVLVVVGVGVFRRV